MSRAGYVLAGGRSSRMGRDKALLVFRGKPLAAAVAETVAAAAGSVTLVGGAAVPGYRMIQDLHPGGGPLGGILTVLRHTTAEWNLVTACDMPELTVEFLTGLLDSAEQAGADVLMPAAPGGLPEPLCAVYRNTARRAVELAFHAGIRKVTTAFGALRAVQIPISDVKPLQNVNTPEDWAAYAAR